MVYSIFFQALLTSALLLSGSTSGATTPRLPAESIAVFTPARAHLHLDYLASDAMMGRNTPSRELDSAAAYIAARFREYGLEPVNGTYFHEYTLERAHLGDSVSLTITSHGAEFRLALKNDFIPFGTTAAAAITNAPVVFVGYGISAPAEGYDDYTGIDVRGRIVVAVKGEPATTDTARFDGAATSRYAQLAHKMEAAARHGAAALLLVPDALRMRRLRPVGYPWPSLYPKLPSDALPLMLPHAEQTPIAAIDGGEKMITTLFGTVNALRELQTAIDSTYMPHSRVLDTITASLQLDLSRESYTVYNVMGLLRGSKRPAEYVAVGAHYDHVGYFTPGGRAAEMSEAEDGTAQLDSIYNGADDNASGTTGLLLAAEALADAPVRPDRSVLFLAFSGEEKGLLGSRAFVTTPPLPLADCVAMLNMDMIGRNTSDSLSIGGNTRSPQIAAWNEEENNRLAVPFALAYDIEEYFFRSDQANFALKGIPVLFYHSGEHEDYHRVNDEIDKINFDKLLRAAQLCTHTLWRIAHEPERPAYIRQEADER